MNLTIRIDKKTDELIRKEYVKAVRHTDNNGGRYPSRASIVRQLLAEALDARSGK